MRDTVTLRDVYDAIGKLEEKVGRRIEKVEEKVNSLEEFKDRAIGIISIITVALSAVFSWLWKKILPE